MAATTSGAGFLFGDFELRPRERRLLRAGAPIPVSPRAFDLLVVLVERAGSLVTKDDLLEQVWPGMVVEENAVQVQVSALRKAIGSGAIRTVSGHGYRFEHEVRTVSAAPQPIASNLPRALTSFIGREIEIEQIRRLLDSAHLLSLVGAGGCGKSRLALQVAQELLPAYADGVWLVELAALSDPSLVPNALAAVLGLKEDRGTSHTQAIVAHLSGMRCLILLDNAEHLLEAVGTLADAILRQCEQVRLLVTSRSPLAVAGESTYRVPSLSVPDPRLDATAERLKDFESARLFVERIKLQRPHFTMTDENAAALASICHRLDGMPLAIELAAPCIRAMSVEEVNQRIDRRFALLTGGPRTAMHRQRTLRATVDWSYELLSEAERALLRRLSVFSGGWTLDAAQAVCGQGQADANQTLDLMMSLADKSLVLFSEEHRASRFSMLQTVREYAFDRLREDDDPTRWQSRHLDYFLALAEETSPLLKTVAPSVMERMNSEHDNLRAALSWSATPVPSAKGLRLAAALHHFWWWGGHWGEGLAALLRALAGTTESDDRLVRANALKAAGVFAGLRGDYDASRSLHEQGLAIYRESGDLKATAAALLVLGVTEYDQGRYDAARACQEEGLAIAREVGDLGSIRKALNNLGNVLGEVGDFAAARRCHEESLGLARDAEDQWNIGASLNNLAVIARYEGDLATARARCEECLAMYRRMGVPQGIAMGLVELGQIVSEQGDEQAGAAMLGESLSTFSRMGDRSGIIGALDSIAYAIAPTHAHRAARLWGALEHLRQSGGIAPSPTTARRLEARIAAARMASGDDAAFEREWQAGRNMDLAQAVQYCVAPA